MEPALAQDPGFIAGHQLAAAMMLSAIDGQALPMARASLASAAASRRRPTERERSLQAALGMWAEGDMPAANRLLDRHLIDHPRDLLALQLTHMQDLVLGQTAMLRDRIGRALGAWSPADAAWGYLLGMHAFGLEECGDYARAEALGQRALALHADDAWAVHAVAHVYEMQGRVQDGIRWLTTDTERWAVDNALAVHNHWHLALMHLSNDDPAAALALYDRAIAPGDASMALDLVDASALLWRLMLRGIDAGERWQRLATRWDAQADWGWFAFNDLHAMLAFVGAGAAGLGAKGADAIAAAAARAGAAPVWNDLAAPVCEALMAFGQGRYARCASLLLPLLPATAPMGGSHAQRSLLFITAAEAARRGGDTALAQALESEATARRSPAPPRAVARHGHELAYG
jgi:tetratricopeptide (TPR) repeat protein